MAEMARNAPNLPITLALQRRMPDVDQVDRFLVPMIGAADLVLCALIIAAVFKPW